MLAREFNVSVRTLQRAFAENGESVAAYVRDRRLERARRDIAVGHLTLAEIAARWNFTDGSHLTRAFKKRYGFAPSETRGRGDEARAQSPDAIAGLDATPDPAVS